MTEPRVCGPTYPAVKSHKFAVQMFKVRVSNPRITSCLDLKIPFASSKLQAPEPGPASSYKIEILRCVPSTAVFRTRIQDFWDLIQG